MKPLASSEVQPLAPSPYSPSLFFTRSSGESTPTVSKCFGGSDLVKQDGVFICQNCGTKYSVEEAKKMMVEGAVTVEGTVAVEGTVKVDKSEELKNLYILARRAKEADNSENACKYYNEIVLKDPDNWEANFYLVYYKAASCKKGQIGNEAYNVTNCLKSTIKLLVENLGTGDEAKGFIDGIRKDLAEIAEKLNNQTNYDLFINSVAY